jgi:hypothetical protein
MPDNDTLPDATNYRTSGPAVSRQFDFDETPPSEAVVRAVSAVTDSEPTSLEPLYETVDPEALDRLLRSGTAGMELTVRYLDFHVTLGGDGTVAVYPDYR